MSTWRLVLPPYVFSSRAVVADKAVANRVDHALDPLGPYGRAELEAASLVFLTLIISHNANGFFNLYHPAKRCHPSRKWS